MPETSIHQTTNNSDSDSEYFPQDDDESSDDHSSPRSGPVSPVQINRSLPTKTNRKRSRSSVDQIIARKTFRRIVLEISESFAKPNKSPASRDHLLKFESEALQALQVAAEEHITTLFMHANKVKEARKAVHVCKVDFETARFINPGLYKF